MLLKSLRNVATDKGTVSGLLQWASTLLNNHHIDTPRLDAEILLSHLLGCERITLYTHPSKPLKDDIIALYESVIQRRAQRFPLQYITHRAEFMSLDFYVDERVLIPRPETEVLVEAVIKRSQTLSGIREIVIVDIGTGSGNIAVTLAKQLKNARIFAVDISPDALAVAKINAQKHEVSNKIIFLCGDTFRPIEELGTIVQAHFIVSNPPYVANDEFPLLQEEVRDFEPYTALVSGQDGLQAFKRIIAEVHPWLKPGGFIAFEVGEKQAQRVSQLLQNTGLFTHIECLLDYQQIPRIVVAQMEEYCGQNRH